MHIGMQVLEGFAVVRKLRENPRFATLPVVAVSVYAMQGDSEKIMESGFNGYLSKPVSSSFACPGARPSFLPALGQLKSSRLRNRFTKSD